MRCVVGAPRSGTSLVMRTMVLLGVRSPAPPFLPEHENMKEFNPNGFYEFNLSDGIKTNKYQGMAVKLFGGQLYKTDKSLISKLIWVRRNKKDAVKSYDRIRVHLPFSPATSEQIYDSNWELIERCMDVNSVMVDLEDIKKHPVKFVSDLVNYLEIEPTGRQIDDAINNIKK